MIIINFTIIPALIDVSVMFEDYETKSQMENVRIGRNYFFMLLNILLIPVSSASSAIIFFENAFHKSPDKWGNLLASNLMSQQYLTIKFIISLTFVKNGKDLLDGPHKAFVFVMDKIHKFKQRNSDYKTPFEDDTEFELGFNQSYSLVIFLNCMLFSQIAPIIPFFASAYFYIKYVVDKNNLLFVYCHKYESGGQIRKSTKYLMIWNLYIYMLTIIAFFALKFRNSDFYKYCGFVFIILWTIFLSAALNKDFFIKKA